MILEVATIEIYPGKNAAFESAFVKGSAAIQSSKGCRSIRLHKCREWDFRYLMLVEWDKLEDHTIGFRGSEHFDEWRRHVGSFFVGPPKVEHYDLVRY